MENINDVKKIARKFLKKPKVLQMRDTIQVIATSGAYMNLKHTKRGGEYEITDPNDNLIGGGDYDSVLEPFAEFKDLLRSLKLESIKPVVERNQRDRKSTRLNSSHKPISYAVFCLKKKTNS